jgi:hypothetical protein
MVGKLVMRDRRVWKILSCMSTPCDGNAVVHHLDDSRDRREGDGAQGDEALEGAEGNGENFGIFSLRAAHEDRDEGGLLYASHQTRNRSPAYRIAIDAQSDRDAFGNQNRVFDYRSAIAKLSQVYCATRLALFYEL